MAALQASDPFLAVNGLSVFYGAFQALSDIDLEIDAGECVAVIGANGAGKSSLINSIFGTTRKTGEIRLAGRDITLLGSAQIAASGIAIVPEGRRIFPSLSVEENILVGAQIGRAGRWTLDEIYKFFPELVPLRHIGGQLVSGGQQQMTAFARALLANPELILCDEISLGLAPAVVKRIYALLPLLLASGVAVLLVEQETRRALASCDRFYCLLEGRVSLAGRPGDVDEDAITRAYFGL